MAWKKFCFLLISLLLTGVANAQSCLPDGISFTSQTQIDSFQLNYPGCTEIEGDVRIFGENIVHLNGLSVLGSIGGSLQIGSFYLYGSYYVCDGTSLYDLTGLNNLTSIGGNLRFFCNQYLEKLNGLENLNSIGGELRFGAFTMEPPGSLDNPALDDLSALFSLTSVGGLVLVLDCSSLQSLNGIDNIDANTITGLFIEGNTALSTCEVQSVCDFLASPADTIEIDDNAFGCASVEQVVEACETVKVEESGVSQKIDIYPNPASTTITLEISSRPLKNTSLSIYNISGQELITQHLTRSQTEIDINHLPAGIYLVKLQTATEVVTQKLLVY